MFFKFLQILPHTRTSQIFHDLSGDFLNLFSISFSNCSENSSRSFSKTSFSNFPAIPLRMPSTFFPGKLQTISSEFPATCFFRSYPRKNFGRFLHEFRMQLFWEFVRKFSLKLLRNFWNFPGNFYRTYMAIWISSGFFFSEELSCQLL